MEIISIIGIVLGLLVFIFCCSKNINLVISGFLGAFIIILTSGNPIMQSLTDTWASGFAGFVKSYFLIFVAGALFGKVLSQTGGAKRIAIGIFRLCSKSKKNAKFFAALFVPIMYIILSYVGVSGFVIVYTVLDIALEVFKKNDLPWRMYCYGGASCICTMVAPGNLQMVNVAAANICGTDISAGALFGFVGFLLMLVFEFIIIFWDVRRSIKKGEGFLDTGSAMAGSAEDKFSDDTSALPGLINAWMPIIIMVLCAAVLKLNIILAVVIGIVCCFIFMPGRIKLHEVVGVVTAGVNGAMVPILGVSAANAVGTCLKASLGFTVITQALNNIPSVIGGCLMIIVMCFCTASSTAGVNGIGSEAFNLFSAAGLSPATTHRLMMGSLWTCIPPHSAGPVNAMNVAKIDYKDGIWCYIRTNFIGGGLAWLIMLALVMAGIFT